MMRRFLLVMMIVVTGIGAAPSDAAAQTGLNAMTGEMTYVYPITSTTVNTAPVDVHLAWLPSLEQVCYTEQTFTFGVNNPPLTTGYNTWTSAMRHHGGWAICVNGFVVQLFNYVQKYDSPSRTYTPEPEDSSRNWLTVGYDVCNRMTTLTELAEPDVIKLLQADGSVLELRNAIPHDAVADEEDRYVGWYYVNGVNTNAFAVVEYDDTYYPTWIQDLMVGRKTTYVSEWAVRPRVVRYYAGDGLEYVFREIVLPYGRNQLTNGSGDSLFGVMPTVFYLEEINRDNVNILTLKRSKHYPSATDHDLSPGRALVEEFHGHRISYENNFVTIEAEGHTHRLLMTDQFTVPVNDINGATSYLDDEANTTLWADFGSRTRSFHSEDRQEWVNAARMMIRAIVQPNGEVTKVAYEKFERNSPWSWWSGFRPNKVTTRQEITDIEYWDPDPVIGYPTGHYETWYLEEARRNVQPNVNSVVKSMTLSTNHSTPKELRRTLFDWYNPYASTDTGWYATSIRIEDRTLLTNQLRQKTLNYWAWKSATASIDGALDKQIYRYLRNSFDTTGDVMTTVYRKEEPIGGGANMFFYLTENTTWVRDGLANADLQTAHSTYAYTFADYYDMTHATFGNPSAAMKAAYGRGLSTITQEIYEPTSTTNVFRTIETSLATNMLYGATTCTYDDTTLAESATRRALDALRNGSGAISNFSPVLDVNPFYFYHSFRLCPIWGLPSSISIENQLGHFIGGREVTYQTSGVCNLLVLAHRGSATSLKTYGQSDAGGLKASAPYTTQTIAYTNGTRARLPRLFEDQQGSVIMLAYKSGGAPSATRTDNAGVSSFGLAINDFDYLHDDPIAVIPTVRRMNPGGTTIDTLPLPVHNGSTLDGRETTSYGPDKNLTYGRTDVSDNRAMSWAPGDIPSTGWTQRPPYVKLWSHRTRNVHTYAQALCYAPAVPATDTTYDDYRLRSMEAAPVVQRLCTDLSDGRTMTQNSDIRIDYIADNTDKDYLHRESADIDAGHLRVVVTGLSSLEWTFIGRVTFSGGGLVAPVQLDYEFSRDHVFDPVLADTFAIWEIPLDEDVLSAMKAMATNDTMHIDVTVEPTAAYRIPFLELACHAEDAAPRLEFWKSSTIDAIVGNRPDKAAKDFTSAAIMKHADNKAESFAKLDQSSQHVGSASYTASTASLFGRYGKGYGEYLPSNHSAKDWTIDGNPFSGTATRLVTTQMGGLNNVTGATDVVSNTGSTTNNLSGINTITFQDNTTRTSWDTLAAASALVGSPSGFYGICYKSKVIDENGNHMATYVDGLGRTRYVVVDSGGLDLVTTYTYNTRNQLLTVTNPAGQDVTYGYDLWGNVTSVTHPDFSSIRAKYNNVGQVRFTQKKTESPGDGHAGDAVTFYEYDDLGRVTAVGEAVFESSSAFAGLDSSTINLTGTGSTYVRPTVNPSLFWGTITPPLPATLPPLTPNTTAGAAGCLPEWDHDAAYPPYEAPFAYNALERTIIKPVDICVYNETAPYGPTSATNDFEDFTDNPQNGRQAVSYDMMPGSGGSFWKNFPAPATWNNLTTTGSVRNQLGRVAAIAYRDHPYEPYRFRVYSYDERGRVECMIKLTPALGFDAVYYSYNSSDQVTSIHVVDALRQYATWYGYDDNGRVSEMTSWVTAADPGARTNGLGFYPAGVARPTLITRPGGAPRVTYTYDAAGNLTGKVYHDADDLNRELNTAYSYDARWRLQQQDHSWDLDPVSSSDAYTRDNGGRITERNSTLLDGDTYDHTYTYDNAGRLVTADVDHNGTPWKSETYDVDSIARRTQTTKTGVVAGYTYAPLPTSATNAPTDIAPSVNGEILTDDQTYNRDGALNYRYLRPQGTAPTTPWSKEWFFYGYNDRLVKMQTSATLEPAAPTCMVAPPISLSRAAKTEWQYSYSPSGEREIKRLVRSPKTDSTCGSVYPWTYYLLGTNDEQQVVYHGRQISRADCDAGGIGRRVFFYPVEYRSYGVDGVNIVWERDANGAMVARFVGTDIQGSERYAVGKNAYQKVRDYLPFGVDVAVANDQRRGYLGKESDYETAPKYGVVHAGLYHERLMDMSARKYSKTQGAFTSVDALWGMAIETSPYTYSHHDPVNFFDPSGYAGTPIGGGGTGGSGGVTGGGQAKGPWPFNFFMLDAYSSDESKAITSQEMLNRLGWNATKAVQQPQYTTKKALLKQTDGGNSDPLTENIAQTDRNRRIPFLAGPTMWLSGQPLVPKRALSLLPKSLGFRGFVVGDAIPRTSVASILMRKIGLGGKVGRAIPYIGATMTVHDLAKDYIQLHTDEPTLQEYDARMESNPYRGFVIEGFHLFRVDWHEETQFDRNQKKNPYRGFVIPGG